jgi:flagellar basal-body rod protein FlgG
MLSILRGATSGVLAQQLRLDIIANNIANINTLSYKRVRLTLSDLPADNPAMETIPGGWPGGVRIGATDRVFSKGKLVDNMAPWEMAIDGPGFFKVQMPNGRVAFTRDGSFKVDPQGTLITADGYYLSPIVTIPADSKDFFVNPDGTVIVQRAGEEVNTLLANIRLSRFANDGGLSDLGKNLYAASAASGPAQEGDPGVGGLGEIVCQAVEGSNVDLGQEMVSAVAAQRAYSMSVKALQTLDEMVGLATSLRR